MPDSFDIQEKTIYLRISLSASLALLVHTILILVVIRLVDLPEPGVVNTIYVRLSTPDISQPESTPSRPVNHNSKKEAEKAIEPASTDTNKINTIEQSRHQVAPGLKQDTIEDYTTESKPLADTYAPKHTPKQSPDRKPVTPPDPVLAKHHFDTIPAAPLLLPSNESYLDLSGLFDQKEVAPAKVAQVSTRKKKPMTSYEIRLIRHMAESKNYNDKIFKLSRIKRERNIGLGIRLQSNGTLENARIISSSGLEALDAATLRSAYSASPFPSPPPDHAKNDFTYELDIRYLPRPEG
ncbi:MAG: hypothetical protein CSB48_09150 [Proteobacteria bacterium]|nr:MAG: hypothetical protein CSB48_09150 [Pseudomonadota bacterium]